MRAVSSANAHAPAPRRLPQRGKHASGDLHEALDRLGQLVAQGKLTLRVAEIFPPERAAEAQRKLDAGGIRGRLVIVF